MATDGFLFFLSTLRTSEGTISPTDDACDQFAFAVRIGHTLLVDDGLCSGCELWPKVVELCLDVCYFVECDRCSGIALLAASSMTALDVAAEVFCQDVCVQDDIANLKEVTKRLVFAHDV